MGQIETEFNLAMWDLYERTKRECKYNSNRLREMLAEKGGVEAAIHVLEDPEISDVFVELLSMGRLDLTVECLILKSKFRPLFEAWAPAARKKLSDAGYRGPELA
jgi:hypothetical protein